MESWVELERRFQELVPALQYSRLDYQWGAAGEHWRLAGGADFAMRVRFEALARLAGVRLADTAIADFPPDITAEADPTIRWYRGLVKMTGLFRHGHVAQQLNADGTGAGWLYTGSVDKPAEASIVLCLRMAAHDAPQHPVPQPVAMARDPTSPTRGSGVRQLITENPLVSGILATIIGGLILALLL